MCFILYFGLFYPQNYTKPKLRTAKVLKNLIQKGVFANKYRAIVGKIGLQLA